MPAAQPLIPERACGPCHACCTVFDIDDAPLSKPAGTVCSNYNGRGCAIYTDRPQTCRTFHCQWRYEPLLDENWRPDLSGVVITTAPVASGSATGQAICLLVFGDHSVIFDHGFAIYVATSIDRGYEAYHRIARGTGRRIPEARLGVFVGAAVAAGNLAGVNHGIREAYHALMATFPDADAPVPAPGAITR